MQRSILTALLLVLGLILGTGIAGCGEDSSAGSAPTSISPDAPGAPGGDAPEVEEIPLELPDDALLTEIEIAAQLAAEAITAENAESTLEWLEMVLPAEAGGDW